MKNAPPFRVMPRPCGNCPFRKTHALALESGRLQGIVETLLAEDWSSFHCHKTVHNAVTGGEWGCDGQYLPSGQEAMCAGAAILLEKLGRPTVGMRLGRVLGLYEPAGLTRHFNDVIDTADEAPTCS